MKLQDILSDDARYDRNHGARDITGISADSRAIKPGFLFVAVPGAKADGTSFIPQALAAGATAVMAERALQLPDHVAAIEVPNVRRALALAAAKLFPRQPATIAAVTGTSGKTSVAAFTRQIWAAQGKAAASIGTVGVVSPKGEKYGSLTTPDPVELHRTLDGLAADGVTHLALEASSHGLDQHRLDGVKIAAGGFTNLSRDHLDYHHTIEAYLAAKLILFERLVAPGGTAVISADGEFADKVANTARARGLSIFTVGRKGDVLKLTDVAVEGFAQVLRLMHAGKSFSVRLPLVGEFQIENALVAAGLAISTGSDAASVIASLGNLQGAKGRLELVGRKNDAPVFVDYAHKPDALAKALDALRPYVRRKLVVVFGAGGDRDQGKRPLMGAIAAEKADQVIVTDDNPRSENAAAIRAAILATARGAAEIGDRREAITRAIADLRAGDVLLVAGKGHETGQIIGKEILPFSDHEAVAAALRETAA
ncbi:MAG: UDP-N-acetylmuramoyl-L-alanyl-D-glutamate--2,6-diaminopimelate ligase [Xanthobacteraceae bacterium]